MKGLFDEIIDVVREIEKQIEQDRIMEEARSKRKRRNEQSRTPKKDQPLKVDIVKNASKNPQKKKERAKAIGQMDVKTLRDVASNLEGKTTYLDKVNENLTKMDQYARLQDQKDQEEELKRAERIAREDQAFKNLESRDNKLDYDREVASIIEDLKSDNKALSAKKAFIYSEIFRRKVL